MKYILLFFAMVLIGCGNNVSNTKAAQNSDKVYKAEKFENFLQQFTTDSLFQLNRVKFPFMVESYDEQDKLIRNMKSQTDWRHLSFEYDEKIAKRDIDSYRQETKIFSDSAKIELRGIDNGIYVDYLFYNIDGQWYLVLARNYSD